MVNFVMPVVPLFVPGSRPERFAKADSSGADAVILDLEDAVAPCDKDRARDAILANAATLKSAVVVRINAAGTPWHEADIDAVRRLDGVSIMLPKAERPEDVADMAKHMARSVSVIALVESAVGLANLPDILATSGVVAVAFGSVDFSLDLGCAHDQLILLTARNEIVWRSRASGRAAPIDGVTTDLSNPEVTEDDARHAMMMGFGGKMAVHPRQIEPIRNGFRPSENQITWARDIVGAASSGEAVQVKGEMVDLPVIERARRILHRAALV
ncbi:CoA ester lyase [Mesorhizobium sp. M7A.F.Ca.US.010.02.1.1]|uniref:HpcH/HpaI aldolase/citrate lyase family protein n=1 Tax=Mesorhizobium sp. M7A.F.Ca.US.010.02.1.1 TaxID=2496743 RepID=UPI000FD34426|nr:CoA ester lyase [Mesorhizobium sp. M7A.F.Ca.US.010.02.1.1]RUW91840.1 CoA ester lyase [Mesorhizobium sp. M7A.F.Ca.US.010.02.1.1]